MKYTPAFILTSIQTLVVLSNQAHQLKHRYLQQQTFPNNETNFDCTILAENYSQCVCSQVPVPLSSTINALEWVAVAVLLILSACFSGLNVGLLSLDLSGLEIVANGSDLQASKFAKALIPIRRQHNWLLCTLLLGNVAVNSLISILLADKTSGVLGFIISTAAIVLGAEIFPQAIATRHPLVVGYYTRFLVMFFMAVLYVIARPLAFLLDKLLGTPIGTVYAREEFVHLVEMQRKAGA